MSAPATSGTQTAKMTASNPSIVKVPDVLQRFIDDPSLFAENSRRLAEAIDKQPWLVFYDEDEPRSES